VQQGKLPAVKLGSRWKIDARQLHAWIAEHGPRAHDGEERLWLLVGARGEGPSALESLAGSRHTVRTVSHGDLPGALAQYQKALEFNSDSSLASYRIGELLFTQRNYQASVNAFRDALRGDDVPPWTEVWSHIEIGKIFDITGQRDRAVNEYRLAVQTNDNTQGAVNQARAYLQTAYKLPDTE